MIEQFFLIDDPSTTTLTSTTQWTPPSREKAPDTDNCPQSLWPPEPVTTSERLSPGAVSPTPLVPVYSGPCGVTKASGYKVEPDVVASAWLVADIDSGEVVAMKDPHGRYRPASIIKVLLALVVLDELDLDEQVAVSAESAAQEGSAAGIGEDGEYTVRDLLHGLILNSGNDCAHALAQKLGGDAVALVKVNELAAELGLADTRATSYSGLDAPGMSTSAWDMGLAYRAAFNNPAFAEIADTESYPFPGFGDLPGFELWNDNKLYLNDPDGIGGKTGYTDDANHTFVGAVNHDGRRLLAVVLDTTVHNDHRAWEQAQMLLHAAYPVAAGGGVAQLEPVAATTTATAAPSGTGTATPTSPSPAPGAPGAPDVPGAPADSSRPSVDERYPWLPIAIVSGVLALAVLAIWLTRRAASPTTPRAKKR